MPAQYEDPIRNQGERKPILGKDFMTTRNLELIKPFVLTVLPWFGFSMLSCLIVFVYGTYPVFVWFFAFLFAVLSLSYVGIGTYLQRRGKFYVVLGILCTFAAMFGVVIGFYTYYEFMAYHIAGEERRFYSDVRPDEEASSHTDAGRLIFSEDAYLAVERAVGYLQGGTTYCVVPVAVESQVGAVQFWAVGEDCCKDRKTFECDDAARKDARGGLVLLNESSLFASNSLENYQKAVEEAEGAYGIESAKEAMFVRWMADPEALLASYWNYSAGILLVACLIYLLVSVVMGRLLHAKL